MSYRPRKHKKRFRCGHRGFGQYCHCCADRQARQQVNRQARQQEKQVAREAKQHWRASFARDTIDLTQLPKRIVLKARNILAALEQGTRYWQVAGKRLQAARDIVRIPVTRRYRLLCRDDGQSLTPLAVMSHEDYNPLFRSPKRRFSKFISGDRSSG